MRYSQSEKMEIIRLVEQSALGVKRTLAEFGLSRSAFYRWYCRYAGARVVADRFHLIQDPGLGLVLPLNGLG